MNFKYLIRYKFVRAMATTTTANAEILRVKKLSEHAIIPTRGSEYAAGYDLSSAIDTVIPARGKGIVKTDLAIAIPEFTYARIAPRYLYYLLFLYFFSVLNLLSFITVADWHGKIL